MALKLIANEDRVITKTSGGGWTPGNPNYTEHPSAVVKAEGKAILLSRISWIMAACTFAGYNFISGATNNPISPTCTKVKEMDIMGWDGKPLRKDDKGDCMGIFVMIAPPFTVVNCKCDFEITNAGQTTSRCQ